MCHAIHFNLDYSISVNDCQCDQGVNMVPYLCISIIGSVTFMKPVKMPGNSQTSDNDDQCLQQTNPQAGYITKLSSRKNRILVG